MAKVIKRRILLKLSTHLLYQDLSLWILVCQWCKLCGQTHQLSCVPLHVLLPIQVYFEYVQSWIRMLQHLPQASHGLKNLLEQEWDFSKQVVPFVRGGEARAGRLFWWESPNPIDLILICDHVVCFLNKENHILGDITSGYSNEVVQAPIPDQDEHFFCVLFCILLCSWRLIPTWTDSWMVFTRRLAKWVPVYW